MVNLRSLSTEVLEEVGASQQTPDTESNFGSSLDPTNYPTFEYEVGKSYLGWVPTYVIQNLPKFNNLRDFEIGNSTVTRVDGTVVSRCHEVLDYRGVNKTTKESFEVWKRYRKNLNMPGANGERMKDPMIQLKSFGTKLGNYIAASPEYRQVSTLDAKAKEKYPNPNDLDKAWRSNVWRSLTFPAKGGYHGETDVIAVPILVGERVIAKSKQGDGKVRSFEVMSNPRAVWMYLTPNRLEKMLLAMQDSVDIDPVEFDYEFSTANPADDNVPNLRGHMFLFSFPQKPTKMESGKDMTISLRDSNKIVVKYDDAEGITPLFKDAKPFVGSVNPETFEKATGAEAKPLWQILETVNFGTDNPETTWDDYKAAEVLREFKIYSDEELLEATEKAIALSLGDMVSHNKVIADLAYKAVEDLSRQGDADSLYSLTYYANRIVNKVIQPVIPEGTEAKAISAAPASQAPTTAGSEFVKDIDTAAPAGDLIVDAEVIDEGDEAMDLTDL